ncbi:MAG: PHB depolymerase family esterase, partial [Humidesulfovibrio sp.]|nr:PHB depolymerase family esterase [Humidesulfovibrio sp.]
PAQPKVPVVKALPGSPAGSQSSTTPQYAAPLPGSAFSDAPGQPAKRQRENTPRPETLRLETLRLSHDGLERLAYISLPQSRQQKAPAASRLPLVVFLHGAGGSARQAMQQTRLAALAERVGFIAAFPEGLAAPQGQEYAGIQTWNAWSCCGYARDQKADDVGYLAALISRLKADYPVDPRRVFLAGFSNGAMLASRFALERPGVAAAIASVAGYLPCDAPAPPEPLPVLIIHGNHDRVARFGPPPGQPRTGRFCEDFPAKAQVVFWVQGQNLRAKPQQVQDGQNRRTRVERYGPDKNTGRALVEFVIVKGGGHAWPGGEPVRYRYCDLPTPDPDATTLVWDFFKRQARPGAPDKAASAKPAKGKGKG